jgi:tungstate transport system ATP-binding protein
MVPQFYLNSIRKRYEAKVALSITELELWPGHLYLLTGPNGSGKSTLLNILAFLIPPDEGDIQFAGKRVFWKKEDLTRLRKKVTLLQQSPFLFSGTVFENVAYGLKIRGVPVDVVQQSVCDSLARVGLDGFETRNVRHLSGGEARRVAWARALVLKPEVLLLDEPLANVDTDMTSILEPLIASQGAEGTTVVMSTHDAQQSLRLQGTAIRLQDGEIVHADQPNNTTPGSRERV